MKSSEDLCIAAWTTEAQIVEANALTVDILYVKTSMFFLLE